MYKVSRNRRCLESCELIYNTLLGELKDKHLGDITITTVSQKSGVSRVTFYKHFGTLIDVLGWKTDLHVKESFKKGKHFVREDIYLTTRLFYEYWVQHSLLLEILIKENCYFLLRDAVQKEHILIFGPLIDESDIPQETKPYLLRLYPTVTSSILQTWIICGKKESVSRLVSISMHNNKLPLFSRGVSEGEGESNSLT